MTTASSLHSFSLVTLTQNKQQAVTIMQWIPIKVRIAVHKSTARRRAWAFVEECFDAEVVESCVISIWATAALDVEPPGLSHRNAHEDDDDHVTYRRYVVTFFSLKTTHSVPASAAPWPKNQWYHKIHFKTIVCDNKTVTNNNESSEHAVIWNELLKLP